MGWGAAPSSQLPEPRSQLPGPRSQVPAPRKQLAITEGACGVDVCAVIWAWTGIMFACAVKCGTIAIDAVRSKMHCVLTTVIYKGSPSCLTSLALQSCGHKL